MIQGRWTLRARLTVVYTALFLLAGVLTLSVMYVLLRQTLNENAPPPPGISQPSQLPRYSEEQAREQQARAEQVVAEYRAAVLRSLVQKAVIVLGGAGVLAAVTGWMIAGRTLRPLGEITATARRVARSADRNLHERIGLRGPRDELKELADTFDEMLERLD